MTLQGKGFYIWKIRRCDGGDVQVIAERAAEAGLSHILVKIADGVGTYNIENGVDLVPPLVQALRTRGIQVWGWHYLYGFDPIGEADQAIRRMQALKLDGYVIDAEAEYKNPGRATAARNFMRRLRSGVKDVPVALSSYRYPTYHPQLPWKEFLESCDLNMPQVYWMKAHNPAEQLARSLREFQAMVPFRPVIPTGAAFTEHGWTPTTTEVTSFLAAAKALNLTAANFWEWSNTRLLLPNLWTTIQDFDWPVGASQADIAQRYLAALNTRDPGQVVSLYDPGAVHITSARTVRGESSLRSWYSQLFGQILPNANFNLVSFAGQASSRYLSWTAASAKGKVENGSDTLGLLNGKIVYHYSSFSLSK